GQYRSVAERARPKLFAALVPSNKLPLHEEVSGRSGRIFQSLIGDLVGPQMRFDLLWRALGPKIGVCHLPAAHPSRHRGGKCGPDRPPVVTCGRLNEYPVHQSSAEKQAVSLGIERHASGETQISAARERNRSRDNGNFSPLARILYGPCDIAMKIYDGLIRLARRSELLLDTKKVSPIFPLEQQS